MNGIVTVNSGLVMGPAAAHAPRRQPAPVLSHAQYELLQGIEGINETGVSSSLTLPLERPLRVILDGREVVTLMTLGAAPELLTLGYLRNQRVVQNIDGLAAVEVQPALGRVLVTSRCGALDVAAARGSACALGSALDGEPLEPLQTSVPSHDAILTLLETARAHDVIHRAAGSVHSAILFDGTELVIGVEDVSRHNGVDTVCGWLALHAAALPAKILFTTGRLTAEMVLKAAFNGIGTLVSRNGTTALGWQIAARLNMTLIVRAANRRYTRLAGP